MNDACQSGFSRLFIIKPPTFLRDSERVQSSLLQSTINSRCYNISRICNIKPEDIHFPEEFKTRKKERISFEKLEALSRLLDMDSFDEWYNKQSEEEKEMINSLINWKPSYYPAQLEQFDPYKT